MLTDSSLIYRVIGKSVCLFYDYHSQLSVIHLLGVMIQYSFKKINNPKQFLELRLVLENR